MACGEHPAESDAPFLIKTADPLVKITVALGEKACYNNAETSVHKKSITQSQEDNGYGIY